MCKIRSKLRRWYVLSQIDQIIKVSPKACPCHDECHDGCDGCPNNVCQCADPQNNIDFKYCASKASLILGQCNLNCSSDAECIRDCNIDFSNNIEFCPCQVNKIELNTNS